MFSLAMSMSMSITINPSFPGPHSFICRRPINIPADDIPRNPNVRLRMRTKPAALPKKRKGSGSGSEEEEAAETRKDDFQEAAAETTKEDLLEKDEALEATCHFMGLLLEKIHGDKFPIHLEEGNEHQMFLNVLKEAFLSSDPTGVFEKHFPLVEPKVIGAMFLQIFMKQCTAKGKKPGEKDDQPSKEEILGEEEKPSAGYY